MCKQCVINSFPLNINDNIDLHFQTSIKLVTFPQIGDF